MLVFVLRLADPVQSEGLRSSNTVKKKGKTASPPLFRSANRTQLPA